MRDHSGDSNRSGRHPARIPRVNTMQQQPPPLAQTLQVHTSLGRLEPTDSERGQSRRCASCVQLAITASLSHKPLTLRCSHPTNRASPTEPQLSQSSQSNHCEATNSRWSLHMASLRPQTAVLPCVALGRSDSTKSPVGRCTSEPLVVPAARGQSDRVSQRARHGIPE